MTQSSYGVHSIDHFAINVPSLEQAAHFYRAFGLEVNPEGQGIALRAADGRTWARVRPAERKSLAYISFNCFAEDFAGIRAQVESQVPLEDGSGEGLWFHDPDGNLINVKVGEKAMPDDKTPAEIPDRHADQRGAVTRDKSPRIRPQRLAHLLLFSPDVPRAVDFYQRTIGLRLSDKSKDIIAFTHAPHGCDHHLVAFAKSSAKGFHHAAWEVHSVEAVGIGAEQMRQAGYDRGWGVGRHCLGSNFFHYVRDPWGSYFEYSYDIDYISKDKAWDAGDYAPENSLYLWGPDVPPDFIENTEIDR